MGIILDYHDCFQSYKFCSVNFLLPLLSPHKLKPENFPVYNFYYIHFVLTYNAIIEVERITDINTD